MSLPMRCERMRATISVESCLANIKRANAAKNDPWTWCSCEVCLTCQDGVRAASGEMSDHDIEELKRTKMEEHKMPVEWNETRAVESSDESKEIAGQKTKQKIKHCNGCNKDLPVDKFSKAAKGSTALKPRCNDCYRTYKRAWEERRREALRGAGDITKAKPEPRTETLNGSLALPEMQKNGGLKNPPSVGKRGENVIILDFSPYPQLLEEIKRLALDQERPVEVQARFLLRRFLQIPRSIDPNQDRYQAIFPDLSHYLDGGPTVTMTANPRDEKAYQCA